MPWLSGEVSARGTIIDSTHAVFRYEFPIRDLLLRAKFEGDFLALQALTRLAVSRCNAFFAHKSVLVPVPMTRLRRSLRGFNQAEIIAQELSRQTATQIEYRAGRSHFRVAQSKLQRVAERKTNVRGAFEFNGDLMGQSCVVVDDIVTTGATAAELARTLKQAGASAVHLWVCAATV